MNLSCSSACLTIFTACLDKTSLIFSRNKTNPYHKIKKTDTTTHRNQIQKTKSTKLVTPTNYSFCILFFCQLQNQIHQQHQKNMHLSFIKNKKTYGLKATTYLGPVPEPTPCLFRRFVVCVV